MKILISNLTFKCIVGILDFERIKKQKVIINLSFEYKFSKDSFINYAEISTLVKETMKKEKFLLLEDAILHFEKLLYKNYKIKKLSIQISKPDILKDCVVTLSN